MKYTIKTLVLFFVFTLVGVKLVAQQQTQYTQYMYTPSLINPAYVGIDQVMKISALHRSQWIGVHGAPVTQTLMLSTPLGQKTGMGFNIVQDQIGPANETNASLDLSYGLQLNDAGLNLSFGMKGGVQLLNVDFTKLTTENPNDSSLNENINSRITPNIGAGMYVYNNDWYVGFSAPNLLSTKHYNRASVSTVTSATHYYLTGGMNFNVNENTKFKPAFLIKSVTGAPTSIDFSLNFLFNNKFTTGLSYRYNASVSGLIDFKVSSSFSLGYAYDVNTSDIGYFSGGSHEVLLRYYVNRVTRNVRKPTWEF
jgi:type IX secretion system PorP/SprF family membrane protein